MNVASLELCKELYELSGWRETFFVYQSVSIENVLTRDSAKGIGLGYENPPAYDLGYLLRKLPREVARDKNSYFYAELYLTPTVGDMWNAGYRVGASFPDHGSNGETPEDAAAKLAIRLFKQGILTK